MTTTTIQGITFTLTEETYLDYLQEGVFASVEEESVDEGEELWQALRQAEMSGDWDLYSDLYKDLFGVRPRG